MLRPVLNPVADMTREVVSQIGDIEPGACIVMDTKERGNFKMGQGFNTVPRREVQNDKV